MRGDICTLCCGTEREVTVDCPLDCEYLLEARRHEKPEPLTPDSLPNRDIRVSEKFLQANEELLIHLGRSVAMAAHHTPGAVDFDVRETLESLIRTFRTLESGVYYESVPANALAANIFRLVQQSLAEFRKAESQRLGLSKTRDADVLGCLVFLQRLEWNENNGRRRGRAFLGTLQNFYAGEAAPVAPPSSSLLLP